MYLPPHFAAKNEESARQLIRDYPFASLISNDDDGLPFVTPLPLHLIEEEGGQTLLLGHCAKPNPHWRYLQARPQAVVTFMGPHAYMTPRVYPDLVRVPTWNYVIGSSRPYMWSSSLARQSGQAGMAVSFPPAGRPGAAAGGQRRRGGRW